ncbi:MAG: 4Fe-4S binding protein [Campylobacteraceae bacterium]|jgi:ferredoxin|nr:4Fe-4S binding protein [Campylobacteraceae bacterium]
MIRKIIVIDEEKCDGCGICINACEEGAIGLVEGKAKLLRDDYCDGFGNCLPACPVGAITFTQREALAYDEEAVKKNITKQAEQTPLPCGCPGASSKVLKKSSGGGAPGRFDFAAAPKSQLNQWPVQIKLIPISAPYFENAHLLVAADCAAYANGNFHNEFMKNKITIIGCPKLDEGDYTKKLTEIITQNNIKSVTVVRMEVPCCFGIENAVVNALKNSSKMLPWRSVVLSLEGEVMEG